jgi:hypothetical protein
MSSSRRWNWAGAWETIPRAPSPAVTESREIVEKEVAELETRSEEIWEEVEQPRLRDWRSGVEMDLGPEGTRLRRYAASADGLFRSAWTKLERLRKD